MLLLSGDHEGTLIVPWPPYKYAMTLGAPPETGISLRVTLLYDGCEFTGMSGGNEI